MTEPGMVSIVIVTCNQWAFTQQCLESLRKNTRVPHEVIVVDNGSSDGTADRLRGQADVRLVENGENRGFPAAANQGLRAARGEFLLLLNNDVVVPAGWLERLAEALRQRGELGLVGPSTNCISGPQEIPVPYGEVSPGHVDVGALEAFAGEVARRIGGGAGRLEKVERLVGFCLLFRRAVLDKVGLLDERFGTGNFEDDDFCRRAAGAGFGAAIVRDAFVHHYGSATFRGQGVDLGNLLARNQRLYAEKWGAVGGAVGKAAVVPALPAVPRVSVCMIVRDSARTLGACLESIRPWVDEMIVVDTGSKDQTVEMARGLGARVSAFGWVDSFAAARNESLREATGDWLFWMDADDTMDAANGAKLRALARRPTAALGYVMQVRCPPSGEGGEYERETVVDHVKMVRRHADIRFTGRIHEQILPAIRRLGGEIEWTDIFVVHSGADRSEAGRARKRARDLRLLELELAEDPDSSFALFNMGMTLLDARRPAEALGVLARSLQLASAGESHMRKVYALLTQAYGDLGRHGTALKTCRQGLGVFPEDAELVFRQAQLQLALGDCGGAGQAIAALLARPGGPGEGGARYFASFDRGILGVRAWQILAVARERQERWTGAAEAWQQVLASDGQNMEAWRGYLEARLQAGTEKDLEALAEVVAGAAGVGLGAVPPDARVMAQARLLGARGRQQEALGILEGACESGAGEAVLDDLCRRLFISEQLAAAERWLGELARRRPADAAAALNLGVILLRARKYAAAVTAAQRSLELRPGHAGALDVLSKAQAGVKARSEPR